MQIISQWDNLHEPLNLIFKKKTDKKTHSQIWRLLVSTKSKKSDIFEDWSHPKKMKRQTANSEEGRKKFCDRRYWVTQLLASPTLSKA